MASPRRFRLLLAVAELAMAAALAMVFFYAPTERTMGEVQRLFYFHVASWWIAFLAFFVVAGASAAWLATRRTKYDELAVSAAEVGLVFTTVGLAMGTIWAKPAWGIWWTWDARLTTAFVLWLIYAGYLMLRGAVEDPIRKANLAAVLGLLGAADIPLVYFSIRWWRTQHPAPVVMGGPDSGLHPDMWTTLLVAVGALLLFAAWMVLRRRDLERAMRAVDARRAARFAD